MDWFCRAPQAVEINKRKAWNGISRLRTARCTHVYINLLGISLSWVYVAEGCNGLENADGSFGATILVPSLPACDRK